VYTLARAVRLATGVVVAVILAGILIHVLDANTSNAIVSIFDDAARWLTQPFHGIFSPDGENVRIAVNWGLAAVVYAIAGSLLARLLARSALAGRIRRPWRRRAAT
jgi:multisubunit Na+/H+ antiporter MnhG subunit